jgi:hypothetical protein
MFRKHTLLPSSGSKGTTLPWMWAITPLQTAHSDLTRYLLHRLRRWRWGNKFFRNSSVHIQDCIMVQPRTARPEDAYIRLKCLSRAHLQYQIWRKKSRMRSMTSLCSGCFADLGGRDQKRSNTIGLDDIAKANSWPYRNLISNVRPVARHTLIGLQNVWFTTKAVGERQAISTSLQRSQTALLALRAAWERSRALRLCTTMFVGV